MENEDRASLLSNVSLRVGPDTITQLVLRIRALTMQLLPLQVSIESLKDPTSRIITSHVVDAYAAAAGDFLEALPFALLRAKYLFMRDAQSNIADWDENVARAVACEVIARKVVHKIGPDRLQSVMSTRYRFRETNGENSTPSSALEYAVDKDCLIFLSSSESQLVINSLWEGYWVQKYNDQDDIDYVPYEEVVTGGFGNRFHPSRLSVPKYQNSFRIVIWGFFLLAYSQAVRQPLYKLDAKREALDVWEYILYLMSFAFACEELHKLYATTRLFTWRAGVGSFWTVVSIVTLSLLTAAFVIRLVGIYSHDDSGALHLRSFQVLSCVAPFIWMRLITVFDGMKYIGTMQICVGSMLKESTIFFALLALLFVGFLQAMMALDASDGATETGGIILNTLIQALLQSPDFENSKTNIFGLTLYYLWTFTTTIILLNILISLFASAYDSISDDAEAQYLAFFAGKTIAMIRAPDEFVYPPPFNLVEIFLVVPFEPFLSHTKYAKLNRYVMRVLFFIPLSFIVLLESLNQRSFYVRNWFHPSVGEVDDSPEARDPEVDTQNGLKITKVPFKELIKVFPNITMSSDETILQEIQDLRRRIDNLSSKLDAK